MQIAPTAEEITILTPAAIASAEKFSAINPDALVKFMTTELHREKEVRETAKATFDATDTNKDGLLEEHEYLNY